MRQQHTLAQSCTLTGVGVHSGAACTVRLDPAPVDTGIQLCRSDLTGTPYFRADASSVLQANQLNTTLGPPHASISTVEHLLAALHALQIDNLYVAVDGPEMPILDGSALPFVQAIEQAGLCSQGVEQEVWQVEAPISLECDGALLVALPSPIFRVSYTLSYPGTGLLSAQFYDFHMSTEGFAREIAPCRTFARAEEIDMLRAQGLIRGGSLDNAVVVAGDRVLNPTGLRFANEMARHKILDLIGDIYLIGRPLQAHLVALRSGHATNVALARELYRHIHVAAPC